MIDLTKLDVNGLMENAREQAGERGKEQLGRAFAQLVAEIQRQSDGDEFRFEEIVGDLLGKLRTTGNINSPATAPTAALPEAPKSAEPSLEEKLGKRVLAVSGGAAEADANLDLIQEARKAEPQVLRFFYDFIQRRDSVVREGNRLMLADHRDALRRAEEFERVLHVLLADIFGGAVPADNSAQLLRDAKKELAEIRSQASSDEGVFLQELARVAGVPPMQGETFASYVARVVTALNQKVGIADKSGKLLDEIGGKIGLKRTNGEADDAYRARLLKAANDAAQGSQAYWNDRSALVAIANQNGVPVEDTDTLTQIVEKMIRSQRGAFTQKLRLN